MQYLYRLKTKQPNFFPILIHYKRRNEASGTDYTEDHDYVAPPQEPHKHQEDSLEMKEYVDEKDKDYYFTDANLIG